MPRAIEGNAGTFPSPTRPGDNTTTSPFVAQDIVSGGWCLALAASPVPQEHSDGGGDQHECRYETRTGR